MLETQLCREIEDLMNAEMLINSLMERKLILDKSNNYLDNFRSSILDPAATLSHSNLHNDRWIRRLSVCVAYQVVTGNDRLANRNFCKIFKEKKLES